MVLDKDVKSQLIVLNEAFLVLSDTGLKSKYDYALSNPSALTTPLESEIAVKHQKATDFIDNKLAGTKKKEEKTLMASHSMWFLLTFCGWDYCSYMFASCYT